MRSISIIFTTLHAEATAMLKPEPDLIPFTPSALPPSPWLVFAPHADDETFGMGGSLLKAREQGIETHVIVVTDGALGGQAEDLVSVRQAEVKKAAELLGLASLSFWSVPDRQVVIGKELVAAATAEISKHKPASVFFPAALEIHPDHRATGHIVWQALQGAAQQNIQAYAYEIGVQNPVNRLIDITAQQQRKEQVMAVYASQNSENNYPELVTALDKGRTFSLPPEVGFAEGFYCFSAEQRKSSWPEVMASIIRDYFPA